MATEFTIGTRYRVTEHFQTPVADGHEIGGIWHEHASVELDPGEVFTIVEEHGDGSGWLVAEMNQKLRFNVGTVADIEWQGRFHVRSDCHRNNVEED